MALGAAPERPPTRPGAVMNEVAAVTKRLIEGLAWIGNRQLSVTDPASIREVAQRAQPRSPPTAAHG